MKISHSIASTKDEEVGAFLQLRHCSAVLISGVDLPIPKLAQSSPFADVKELAAKPPQTPNTPSAAPTAAIASPPKPRTMRKNSLEFPEADPWGSPAMHRDHNHEAASPPKTNGTSRTASNGVHEPVRTTSTFTTASMHDTSNSSNEPPSERPSIPAAGVWGSYDGNPAGTFNNTADRPTGGDDGFNGGGGDGPPQEIPGRAFGGGRVTSTGVEENIVIALLPEKEGVFMFQHHNYHVSSVRRNSKVVRRYSDFVWLLDCLQKRFPFRQLPLLPPKRVGVNGNHLAADSTFIEKRRRGLARFSNALVRHPVLSQEQLVIMFLTVPTVS